MKKNLQCLLDLLLVFALLLVLSALLMIVLGESGDMEALLWEGSFALFLFYGFVQGIVRGFDLITRKKLI